MKTSGRLYRVEGCETRFTSWRYSEIARTGRGNSAASAPSYSERPWNAIDLDAGKSQSDQGSPLGLRQWNETQPMRLQALACISETLRIARHETVHQLRHVGVALLSVAAATGTAARAESSSFALDCAVGFQLPPVTLRPDTVALDLTRELEGVGNDAIVSYKALLIPAGDAYDRTRAGAALVSQSPATTLLESQSPDFLVPPQQLTGVLTTIIDTTPVSWLQQDTAAHKAPHHERGRCTIDGAVGTASATRSDHWHPQTRWFRWVTLSERTGGEGGGPSPQHSRQTESAAQGREEFFGRPRYGIGGRARQISGAKVTVTEGTSLRGSPLTGPLRTEVSADETSAQEVVLGTSGSITLEQKDGMWTSDERRVEDGDSITAANGSSYTLRYRNGHWSAEFVPEVRPIVGTPLSATLREDRSGYLVGMTAILPKSGQGDVVLDGKRYHVWMEDGSLRGQIFDLPPHGAETSEGYYSRRLGKRGPTLAMDDKDTVANEEGSRIEVAGGNFRIRSLLDQEWASSRGERIVDGVLAELVEMRNLAEVLVNALGGDPGLQHRFEKELKLLWGEAVSKIGRIFDKNVRRWETLALPMDLSKQGERLIERFDTVIQALSSLNAFEAATKQGGSGVFGRAKKTKIAARNLFNARLSRSSAVFGLTENTRYGAVDTDVRRGGNAERGFSRSEPGAGFGAFAYSNIPTTKRTAQIDIVGDAIYQGGTTVVTGTGRLYRGSIELQIRFDNNSVRGLITSLKTEKGRPWLFRGDLVDAIYLPNATLQVDASWRVGQEENGLAQIVYNDVFEKPFLVPRSSFDGSLLGTGEQAGHESVGSWSIGVRSDRANFLVGSFGAVIVEDAPDTDQTDSEILGDVSLTPTAVVPEGSEIKGGILTLRGTLYGPNPETTRTEADWDDEMLLLDAGRRIEDAYELLLEEAVTREGTVRDYLGRGLIGLAAEEVRELRNDLTAAILIGQDSVALRERSRIWSNINERVRSRVFGTADNALPGRDFAHDTTVPRSDPRKWSSGYPTAQDGSPEDSSALEAIDSVLAALASPDDLADAVAEGRGGVFTRADGLPFRPLGPAGIDDIWERAESRFKLWLQSTDYTRFGAWRKQTAPNAWSEYRDRIEDDENGPNAFAYSRLSPANYNDYGFPVGGTLRYSGKTVAVQGATLYTGTVELIARWHEPGRGQYDPGVLGVAISGLRTPEGAPLRYGSRTVDGSTGDPIGTIYLDGIRVQIDSEQLLYFSDTSPSALSIQLDRASNPFVDLSDDLAATASLEGMFVGRTQRGPKGVVGTWTLRSRNSHKIGTGTEVHGGFGVEISP